MTHIGAIVLAAGKSSRMSRMKLLLPWADGQTIIETVVNSLQVAGASPLVIITGHEAASVRQALAHHAGLNFVHNPDYAQGEMLSSVKTGLRAPVLAESSAEAVLIMLGDVPKVQVETLQAIMAQAEGGQICLPHYQGRSGHPVLFPRAYWPALLDLPEGAAPRALIQAQADRVRRVDVPDRGILIDIDTDADYQRERA